MARSRIRDSLPIHESILSTRRSLHAHQAINHTAGIGSPVLGVSLHTAGKIQHSATWCMTAVFSHAWSQRKYVSFPTPRLIVCPVCRLMAA